MDRNDIVLSKSLSWLLRHAAEKEGLHLSPDGFIALWEILKHPKLRGKFTQDDIKRVVANNDKQRFTLRETHGNVEIRANQGHTLKSVTDLELTPLTASNYSGEIIHGTYFRCLPAIQSAGLSRMNRNHIHFAPKLPNQGVISGARQSAQVFIYIDFHKALADGLDFFQSTNGVILCGGDERGFLLPK